MPMVAVYGMFTTPLRMPTLAVACVIYFLCGFGITGGYHRMWSHRAWDGSAIVRFALLVFGAGAMQGSCRWWCRNHRAHHKFTDTTKDPYNVRKGFLWAHLGWMLFKQDLSEVGPADISDLDADPWIRWQHRYYGPVYRLLSYSITITNADAKISIMVSVVVPTFISGYFWGDYRVCCCCTCTSLFSINFASRVGSFMPPSSVLSFCTTRHSL